MGFFPFFFTNLSFNNREILAIIETGKNSVYISSTAPCIAIWTIFPVLISFALTGRYHHAILATFLGKASWVLSEVPGKFPLAVQIHKDGILLRQQVPNPETSPIYQNYELQTIDKLYYSTVFEAECINALLACDWNGFKANAEHLTDYMRKYEIYDNRVGHLMRMILYASLVWYCLFLNCIINFNI